MIKPQNVSNTIGIGACQHTFTVRFENICMPLFVWKLWGVKQVLRIQVGISGGS